MKNCNNCARLKDNYDGKLFKCGRNASKTFNDPAYHGLFCKHHVRKVVRKNG